MELDYNFVDRSLHELMIIFLENCTIDINFSQAVLYSIILKLMGKCDIETFNLIASEDTDIQKLGAQLLFGEYLYVFNTALNLHHYDYECLHYPHIVTKFRNIRS